MGKFLRLTNGKPVSFDETGGGGGSSTITVTAGENLSIRDSIYISNGDGGRTAGRAYKLDATNDARIDFVGFTTAAISSGNTGTVQVGGELTGFSGLTAGKPVFASIGTPGATQLTAPNTSAQWVIQLGVATSSSSININAAGSATAIIISSGTDSPSKYSPADRNYITNGTFEANLNGWNLFKDAAQTTPVDGTGGSPTVLSTAQTSTNPLSGSYSMQLAQTASNGQGEGLSYDFTIDRSDKGNIQQILFDYEVISGSFVDGDFKVWIYDITNSQLIQPTPSDLAYAIGPAKFKSEFQANSNSTSYRLIIHRATTTATAVSINIDNVGVGRIITVSGAVITDPIAYIPTFSGLGTVTNIAATWSRRGNKLIVDGKGTSGSPTGTQFQITLPNGLTTDANIYDSSTSNMVGRLERNAASYQNWLIAKGSRNYLTIGYNTSPSNPWTERNGNEAVGGSENFSFSFEVAITGWSSNVQLSTDAETRVVAARSYYAGGNGGTSVSANTPFPFETSEYDTHGAATLGSSFKFTAPVAGIYSFNFNAITSVGNANIYVYKNGSNYRKLIQSEASGFITIADEVKLNAGDYIDIRSDSTLTIYGTGHSVPSNSSFSIHRLSGPSQIAASEKIAAKYKVSGSQNATTSAPWDFDVKVFDTHNAVTTGSGWKFTAPASGIYNLSVFGFSISTANIEIDLYKNGTLVESIASSPTTSALFGGSTLISLNAGDYIELRPNGSTYPSGTAAHINIHRI